MSSESKDWVQLDEDKIRDIKELQQDLNAVQQRYKTMLDDLVVSQVVLMIFNKLLRISQKGHTSVDMCFPNEDAISQSIIGLTADLGCKFEKLHDHAVFECLNITRYINMCRNPDKPVSVPALSSSRYDAYRVSFSDSIKVIPKVVFRGDALTQLQTILGNTVIPAL